MASLARLIVSRHHRRQFSPVNIRYSHFSTNGARVVPNGSCMDIGWFQTLMMAVELMVRKVCAVVPQGSAYIVERSSKYSRTLKPGLNFLLPFVDQVSHIHSLKVSALTICGQRVFSKDNVEMTIDACVFYKVVDPYLASYEVKDTKIAMTGLVEAVLRSKIGGRSFDNLLQEREIFNKMTVMELSEEAKRWGLQVFSFEIRDISVSPAVNNSFMMEACANFKKLARILESEGEAESHELKEAAKGTAVSKVLVDEAADQGTTVMLPKGESEKKDK